MMFFFGFVLLSALAFASKKPKENFIFANNRVVLRDQHETACAHKGLEVANLSLISKELLDELAGYPKGKAWIYSIQGNDFGGAPIWIDKKGRITILLKSNSKVKSLKRLALCQTISPPVFFNLDGSSSHEDTPIPPLVKKETSKKDGEFHDIREVLKQVEESIDGKRGSLRKRVTVLSSSEEDSQDLPEVEFDGIFKDTGRRVTVKLPESSKPPTKPPVAIAKDMPVTGNKANKPRPTGTKVKFTYESEPEPEVPTIVIRSSTEPNQSSVSPQPKVLTPSQSHDPEISHDISSNDEHLSESEGRTQNHAQISDEAHTNDEDKEKRDSTTENDA